MTAVAERIRRNRSHLEEAYDTGTLPTVNDAGFLFKKRCYVFASQSKGRMFEARHEPCSLLENEAEKSKKKYI